MIANLPPPIADYVEANARLDVDGMLNTFAQDAVVQDDGGRHQGRQALRAWIEAATVANRAIFDPETVHQRDGDIVLEGLTHGDFKGSPLRFTLRFTLAHGAIRALEIA